MLGRIGCALGKHRVDGGSARVVLGQRIGRCRCCSTILEERYRDVWERPALHDAELGPRLF